MLIGTGDQCRSIAPKAPFRSVLVELLLATIHYAWKCAVKSSPINKHHQHSSTKLVGYFQTRNQSRHRTEMEPFDAIVIRDCARVQAPFDACPVTAPVCGTAGEVIVHLGRPVGSGVAEEKHPIPCFVSSKILALNVPESE